MKLYLHQTHLQISDFENIFNYIKCNFPENNIRKGIHIFPELFLTGYPLQDLCLQKSFINSYMELLKKIDNHLANLNSDPETLILFGGLKYELSESKTPSSIENVILKTGPGEKLSPIYTKMLLPNYDIFDEKKYFTPGDSSTIIDFNGINIATLICEDMWVTNSYQRDPIEKIKATGKKIDLIINLSSSPYNLKKSEKRIKRASEISHILKAPLAYVNKIGAEDEIIFDGQSFIVDGDNVILKAKKFEAEIIEFDLKLDKTPYKPIDKINIDNSWEDLFSPNLIKNSLSQTIVEPLNDDDCKEIIEAIGFGVSEYAKKCNLKNFLVALSGGIDSALVIAILKLSLKKGQSIEAVYMPSEFSSEQSLLLSKDFCKKLQIPLYEFPIDGLHQIGRDLFNKQFNSPLKGLPDENIQSRLRGAIIYGRSNQTGAMVLNTSNKSELAVGYSTIYGDSVGAISLLGDIYKSEVYMLANYINKFHDGLITKGIITRPPTAELRENQKDTDSLPPYETLDAILEGILSYRLSKEELIDLGFNVKDIDKVMNLYTLSEYKRYQFCPILKVKAKSFGFGYRNPICKNRDFYL